MNRLLMKELEVLLSYLLKQTYYEN